LKIILDEKESMDEVIQRLFPTGDAQYKGEMKFKSSSSSSVLWDLSHQLLWEEEGVKKKRVKGGEYDTPVELIDSPSLTGTTLEIPPVSVKELTHENNQSLLSQLLLQFDEQQVCNTSDDNKNMKSDFIDEEINPGYLTSSLRNLLEEFELSLDDCDGTVFETDSFQRFLHALRSLLEEVSKSKVPHEIRRTVIQKAVLIVKNYQDLCRNDDNEPIEEEVPPFQLEVQEQIQWTNQGLESEETPAEYDVEYVIPPESNSIPPEVECGFLVGSFNDDYMSYSPFPEQLPPKPPLSSTRLDVDNHQVSAGCNFLQVPEPSTTAASSTTPVQIHSVQSSPKIISLITPDFALTKKSFLKESISDALEPVNFDILTQLEELFPEKEREQPIFSQLQSSGKKSSSSEQLLQQEKDWEQLDDEDLKSIAKEFGLNYENREKCQKLLKMINKKSTSRSSRVGSTIPKTNMFTPVNPISSSQHNSQQQMLSVEPINTSASQMAQDIIRSNPQNQNLSNDQSIAEDFSPGKTRFPVSQTPRLSVSQPPLLIQPSEVHNSQKNKNRQKNNSVPPPVPVNSTTGNNPSVNMQSSQITSFPESSSPPLPYSQAANYYQQLQNTTSVVSSSSKNSNNQRLILSKETLIEFLENQDDLYEMIVAFIPLKLEEVLTRCTAVFEYFPSNTLLPLLDSLHIFVTPGLHPQNKRY
jgi:hypothetical protein